MEDEGRIRDVPISFPSDGVPTRYVTNFAVQHTDQEFFISFYEVHPPLLLGTREEQVTQLEGMLPLKAEYVARIVVSAKWMPEFVRILQENLEHYKTTFEPGE